MLSNVKFVLACCTLVGFICTKVQGLGTPDQDIQQLIFPGRSFRFSVNNEYRAQGNFRLQRTVLQASMRSSNINDDTFAEQGWSIRFNLTGASYDQSNFGFFTISGRHLSSNADSGMVGYTSFLDNRDLLSKNANDFQLSFSFPEGNGGDLEVTSMSLIPGEFVVRESVKKKCVIIS